MSKILKAILAGGFIAGTLDVGAGIAIYDVTPVSILQAIASGLLGKAAYSGGLRTALLGLVLQWVMSLIIAAIYTIAAKRLPVLTRQWLAMGLVYGVVIWGVMNFVVVPLSAAFPKNSPKLDVGFFIMLMFGVIISYCTRKFSDVTISALS